MYVVHKNVKGTEGFTEADDAQQTATENTETDEKCMWARGE